MTNTSDQGHVYHRQISQQERSSLSLVAAAIRPGSRVLDLGTGSGALGAHLNAGGCSVDGVTYNAAEARIAQPHYRRLEVADLERCDLATMFAGQQYDRIVCADVLEHIRDPARVLDASRALLAPDGELLISVPNAGYSGLVAELLSGEFRYRDEGLLDRTHVRFFTRQSLLRFVHEAGWTVSRFELVRRELEQSEFSVAFDSLPPAVARHLLSGPDALSYQFVIAVRPSKVQPHDLVDLNAKMGDPASARFSAQLYLAVQGQYDEERKLTCAGLIGRPQQTLRFDLPQDQTLTALRLDPADRPGFLHLHRMTLNDVQGNALWAWDGQRDGVQALQAAGQHQIALRPPAVASPSTLLMLLGDDPWFELPLPPALLAGAQRPATLLVEIGWPMSADYLAMAERMAPLQQQSASLQERATSLERLLDAERSNKMLLLGAERDDKQRLLGLEIALATQQLTALQQQHDLLLEDLRGSRHHQATLNAEHEKLQAHIQLLDQQLQASQTHVHSLEGERESLRTELKRLQDHLAWLHNSTVFRLTRPLVRAKMALDRLLGRGPSDPGDPPGGSAGNDPTAPIQPPADADPQARSVWDRSGPEHPVDIVVPVYRGLADTQRCLRSVLASPCSQAYRLIVINDASPEPEVSAWLRQMALDEPRLLLLENEDNLGFVATVNRGMAQSTAHDVVLLNSDTEVANDWLDRLCRAAYQGPRVASVTPFSNNATICSYPRFCEVNALPTDCDTAQLDQMFASANAGQTAEIPTGIGFCMYIRRDCLDQVGLFDVANFGKGYGEENDFCCRAIAAGWQHLHALDVFVLHAGGVSFGASKSARELAAMETLRRLHPDYEPAVHAFLAIDPAAPARQRVDLMRIQHSPLPLILCVLHDRAGGTVRHVRELAQHLRTQAQFLLLTPAPQAQLRLSSLAEGEALSLHFSAEGDLAPLVQTLRTLGLQHLHYHHLIGHSAQVLALPDRLGVRYDFTAHDYYSLCPQISLTDAHHAYCGEQGLAQCRDCLQQSPAPGGVDIETWRLRHEGFLQRARHVFAPSRDAAKRLLRVFPGAPVLAVPHTDLSEATIPPVQAPRLAPGQPLKIVVLGALSLIKGADVLENVAAEAARRGLALDFHLLGYAYRTLRVRPDANLTVHGEYAEADLPRLLAELEPQLCWFPAQWPETYSYTLSAALLQGLPIVAPDLGAFAERLSGRTWSWIRPWNSSVADWLDFFNGVQASLVSGSAAPSAPALPKVPALWGYHQDYTAGMGPHKPIAELERTTANNPSPTTPSVSGPGWQVVAQA